MREPFKWHITINLNNGRWASLRLFGKDVRSICPKNFNGQNNLKVYFLILISLSKMLQVLQPMPLVLVSFFKEMSKSLFFRRNLFFKWKKVGENCTVTPKASYSLARAAAVMSPDSLHTRITVFRGFQREYWSRKEMKYFLSLPTEKKKQRNVSENVFPAADWKSS